MFFKLKFALLENIIWKRRIIDAPIIESIVSKKRIEVLFQPIVSLKQQK